MSDLVGNHIVGFRTRRLKSLGELQPPENTLCWVQFTGSVSVIVRASASGVGTVGILK